MMHVLSFLQELDALQCEIAASTTAFNNKFWMEKLSEQLTESAAKLNAIAEKRTLIGYAAHAHKPHTSLICVYVDAYIERLLLWICVVL